MARVTIADVAAHAGVSKSTVSHAFSGKRRISEETQLRIQASVKALGYRPDPVAQRLADGERQGGIGFVYPLLAPAIAGLELDFITSAAEVINAADYAFLLLTHLERSTAKLEQLAGSGLVDGFILMQVQLHDSRVEILRAKGIPFVLVGRCHENEDLAYVDTDIEKGMRLCVDHLAGLGHRQLAYLYQDDPEFGYAARAAKGYVEACREHGLIVAMEPCDVGPESGADAMNRVLERRPETTAWIVWNDAAAWGVVRAAAARGLRIPEDLSVVCLNYSTVARLLDFEPDYLDIKAGEVAALAAAMIIDLLRKGSLETPQILVQPDLIAGGGRPPAVRSGKWPLTANRQASATENLLPEVAGTA